jgi:peptidoglycan/xylan/chitin deacetylase (PgdA/CDA1 family)
MCELTSYAGTPHQESGDFAALEQEVVGNEEVIMNLTGLRPRLLRPPYGAVSVDVLKYMGQRGYEGVVMWSGGCINWFFHDYQKELPVYINGMADAGALLCFHDNNDAGVGTCI